MKKIFIIAIFFLFSAISLFSQTCEWAEKIGVNGNQDIYGIVLDANSNIYVVGVYESDSLDFKNGTVLKKFGGKDAFLAKYNNLGQCLWAVRIGGSDDDALKSIALDKTGNIYIAGYYKSQILHLNNNKLLNKDNILYDGFIAKYDNSGICQWVENIQGNSIDYSNCIAVDNIGNLFVGGYFNSDLINFNNGISLNNSVEWSAYIAKYDNSGICRWAQLISYKDFNYSSSIAVYGSNNVYLTGYYGDKFETNGYITKFDGNGIGLWSEGIGGDNNDGCQSIAVDNTGNIYVVGYFSSSKLTFNNSIFLKNSGLNDGFIAKYNNIGSCQWATNIAGNKNDDIGSITADYRGNIYIAGKYQSDTLKFNNDILLKNTGNQDGYIAKYKSWGTCQWAEKFTGSLADYASSIVVDSSSNIYVTGAFESTIFKLNNDKVIFNYGVKDGFLAKYSQSITSISDEAIQNNISVYPNPAIDYIEIKPSEGSDIQIFNTMGELVAQTFSSVIHRGNTFPSVQKIDISNLYSGIYFIKIGNKVEKFVKM